jgi:hypothetical protein
MSVVATDLRVTIESARRIRFEPVSGITATNVQEAIRQAAVIFAPVPTPINFGMTPYQVQPTDRILLVDTSGGPISIVMPAAAARSGLDLEVKDITGNADPNNITVTFASGGTVDGLAQVVINNPFGYFKFNPIAAGNYYET